MSNYKEMGPVRKALTKVAFAGAIGAAVFGAAGCEGKQTYIIPNPKTGETLTLSKAEYELYQALTVEGKTPTTSEAGAGVAKPEVSTTTTSIATGAESAVAVKNGDGWSLKNPDGQEVSIKLPEGFTPDKDLIIQNDLTMTGINKDLSVYEDWDNVIHKVAGYNYDENDFSGNADFKENVQGDMFAWRVFQGDRVEVPGIGLLEGNERTSVVVLVLNLQPKVIAWDNEGIGQVYARHGFTATGRIWDAGTPEKIANTEEKLTGHWLFRQKEGTPEKSYIGVTDSPDNAKQTLFVSVAYRQWGNNEDGTPREQFQLLRSDLVTFNK